MLFLLGAKDRRVPLDDAKRYVAALRALPDAPAARAIERLAATIISSPAPEPVGVHRGFF